MNRDAPNKQPPATHGAAHLRIGGRVDQTPLWKHLPQCAKFRRDISAQRGIGLLVNEPRTEITRCRGSVAHDRRGSVFRKVPGFRVNDQYWNIRRTVDPRIRGDACGEPTSGKLRADLQRAGKVVGDGEDPAFS